MIYGRETGSANQDYSSMWSTLDMNYNPRVFYYTSSVAGTTNITQKVIEKNNSITSYTSLVGYSGWTDRVQNEIINFHDGSIGYISPLSTPGFWKLVDKKSSSDPYNYGRTPVKGDVNNSSSFYNGDINMTTNSSGSNTFSNVPYIIINNEDILMTQNSTNKIFIYSTTEEEYYKKRNY